MEEFSAELSAQLQSKISFIIPLFGGIPVPQSVVITWVIIAAVVGFCALATRRLQLQPTGLQLYLEMAVDFVNGFLGKILGPHGQGYACYLGTVGIYLVCANIIGILGFTPPTKDLNVTAGLAIMSIVLVEYAALRRHGVGGFFKKLAEPMPLIAPMNVLEIFIRPLSLCMRLFGNILGAFIIMELIKLAAPLLVPIPFSLYFDVFDGILQAYIFVFLTALFIGEAVE